MKTPWYYYPNYADKGSSFKLVDNNGEQIGIVETEDYAELICDELNNNLDKN
jgi:hypothetical protein